MATFYTFEALAQHQRMRNQRVRQSIKIGANVVIEEVQKKAIQLLSGGISQKELTALGHPFAKARFGGLRGERARQIAPGHFQTVPLLPINIQTRQLLESLKVVAHGAGEHIYYELFFTSPHAIVLTPGGTQFMRDRGFWAALNRFIVPFSHETLLDAKQRAERG